MRILDFEETWLEPIVAGDKRTSLRRCRNRVHVFAAGEIAIAQFQGGANILLRMTAATEVVPCASLTEAHARQTGFTDLVSALDSLYDYRAALSSHDLIAVLRYEPVIIKRKLIGAIMVPLDISPAVRA